MIKEIQGLRAIAIIMVLVVHGLAIVPPSWQDYVIKLQRLFFTSTGRGRDFFCTCWIFSHLFFRAFFKSIS